MIRGIYTAASAMLCEIVRQDMIANNLANVNTAGFKRTRGIFKERPTMELRRVNDGKLYPPRPLYKYPTIGQLGTGAILDESFTDFSAGKMEYTGNDLDFALENNKAFFLIETPQGIRFTRDGVFTLNQDGVLVTMNGDAVLAEPEPQAQAEESALLDADGQPVVAFGRIQVDRLGRVLVDEDGRVHVNGEPLFRIVRGQASDRHAFRKAHSNHYVRAYGEVMRADGLVRPGYIERPNFSLVEEMVKMIEVSRAYEANSKVIQAHDSLLDRAVNSVGPTRR